MKKCQANLQEKVLQAESEEVNLRGVSLAMFLVGPATSVRYYYDMIVPLGIRTDDYRPDLSRLPTIRYCYLKSGTDTATV